MSSKKIVVALVLAASLTGCLGSEKGYRPYRGEPRPLQNPPPDPTEEKLRLETMSYDDVQRDVTFTQSRKDIVAVTKSVPKNPWRSYEQEMTNEKMAFLLGPYAKIKKAEVLNPDEEKKKKQAEGGEEGAGEKKPEPKKEGEGDKPADKPADKKDEGGGEKKEGEGN